MALVPIVQGEGTRLVTLVERGGIGKTCPERSMQTFLEWWKRYEVEKLPGLTEKVQAMYRSMYRRLSSRATAPRISVRRMGKYLTKPDPRPKRQHLSYDEVLQLSSVVHHDFKALILAMGDLG